MKYPKAAGAAILSILVLGVALSFQKTIPAESSPRYGLKDAPHEVEFKDVGAVIKDLKEKTREGAGVEGKTSSVFRYDLKTGVCRDESGREGFNERSVAEVVASKDGECVRFGLISKPGGIHRDGDFDGWNLRGADLSQAILNYVVINDADFRGAKMRSFQFGYGRFWGRIDKFTQLPDPENEQFRNCRLDGGSIFCFIDGDPRRGERSFLPQTQAATSSYEKTARELGKFLAPRLKTVVTAYSAAQTMDEGARAEFRRNFGPRLSRRVPANGTTEAFGGVYADRIDVSDSMQNPVFRNGKGDVFAIFWSISSEYPIFYAPTVIDLRTGEIYQGSFWKKGTGLDVEDFPIFGPLLPPESARIIGQLDGQQAHKVMDILMQELLQR